MDRRAQNIRAADSQTSRQNARFSWQMPVDEQPLQQLSQADAQMASQQYSQQRRPSYGNSQTTPDRFSYTETPLQAQNPTFPRVAQRYPSEPTIPQSPITPIDLSPISPSEQRHYPLPNIEQQYPQPQLQQTPQPQFQQNPQSHFQQPPRHDHWNKLAGDMPSSPYNIEPPKETHPALHNLPQAQHNVHEEREVFQQPHPDDQKSPQGVHQPSDFPQQRAPPYFDHPTTPISPPHSPRPMKSDHDDDIKKQRLSTPLSSQPYTPHTDSRQPPTQAIFAPDAPVGPNGAQAALHQPGQIAHPNMNHVAPGEDQAWNSTLCGCGSDVGTCLTGIFCPCVLYGKTSHRMSLKSEKKDPTDLLSWSWFNSQCCVMAATCGLCIFPLFHRTRLRHMYKLKGSLASDIVRSCCCCCCTLIQNEREIRDREENKRMLAGPASAEAYKLSEQMIYAPPPRAVTRR